MRTSFVHGAVEKSNEETEKKKAKFKQNFNMSCIKHGVIASLACCVWGEANK